MKNSKVKIKGCFSSILDNVWVLYKFNFSVRYLYDKCGILDLPDTGKLG